MIDEIMVYLIQGLLLRLCGQGFRIKKDKGRGKANCEIRVIVHVLFYMNFKIP